MRIEAVSFSDARMNPIRHPVTLYVLETLLTAIVRSLIPGSVHSGTDFSIVLVAFLLLTAWAQAPWLVVFLGAVAGVWFL